MESKIGNLIIMGHSTASGGLYDKVKVNGEATITGDIECETFVCNGKVKVLGSLKAKFIRINGEATFEGNVETNEVKVFGQLTIGKEALIKTVTVYGQISVKGNMSVDALNLKGELKVAGDCEAELFRVKGAFTINGLLNVGVAEIVPYGDCKAAEIGGEKILVKKANRPFGIMKWFKFFSSYEAEMITDMIEGDDLELHNAKIKIVRANRVKLGKGTTIDRVEYRDHLEKHEEAIVKEAVQVTA